MKFYICFILSLAAVTAARAQQRDSQLTRRQKILNIQQGTTLSEFEAEMSLKQKEDGWKFCTAGALTALATAGFWVASNNKDVIYSYAPHVNPLALDACANCCGLVTYTLCCVGCLAICDC